MPMILQDVSKKYGIGLTGGIATGKSVVAKIIRDLGCRVWDADQLSRLVVEPGGPALAAIVAAFGGSVLDQSGALDRRRMREVVFESEEKRRTLERIVHPAIASKLEEELIREGLHQKKEYWFYEAALLIETGNHKRFNSIWLTHCSKSVQVSRLMSRDDISEDEALRIISSQMSFQKKQRFASFVIDTDQTIATLTSRIKAELDNLSHNLL